MYKFSLLSEKKSNLFRKVEFYFNNYIRPIYGNQDSALKKISKATDRKCWLLSKGLEELGLLVYKSSLVTEYRFKNAFEIKTLFVINPQKNSGKKIATRLLYKACKEALKMNASAIFVTASSERPEAINFFLKRGFKIKNRFHGLHKNNCTEFLLMHPSPLKLFFLISLKLFSPRRKKINLVISHPTHLLSGKSSSTR